MLYSALISGGNAKTLMFVNISPADYNTDETVTSLTWVLAIFNCLTLNINFCILITVSRTFTIIILGEFFKRNWGVCETICSWGNKTGAVVRALASHQCGSGSNPGPSIVWVSLLLVLVLARGFFSGFSGFPPSTKPNITKFQFDRKYTAPEAFRLKYCKQK